jgi:hypothetical protein
MKIELSLEMETGLSNNNYKTLNLNAQIKVVQL